MTSKKVAAHQQAHEPSSLAAALFGALHDRLVYQRRIQAIAQAVSPLLPGGKLLDVGLGNGDLPQFLMSMRPDVDVIGLDVLIRVRSRIPAVSYNGDTFPFCDQAFSSVLIADTLHHVANKEHLLAECLRVSRGPVIVKDHFYKGRWQHILLRLLDLGGNAAHGVESIYNYYTRKEWEDAVRSISAEELVRVEEVAGQYPFPFQRLIGRRLQFVSSIISASGSSPQADKPTDSPRAGI